MGREEKKNLSDESPTCKKENVMQKELFIECEIKRETEKAIQVALEVADRIYRDVWFPKSRAEAGQITPTNGSGERKGLFTESWLLDAKLRDMGGNWQKSVTIWSPDGTGCGLVVG
jgi:hypothetical protein